jgi:hypothetical protein
LEKTFSNTEKDLMLRQAFGRLRARGISSKLTEADRPFTELSAECSALALELGMAGALRDYLRVHTVVPRAFEMFFTHMAMAARARWQDVPADSRGIAARGWFIGRWLPTFLVIDGPLGRLMNDTGSPLTSDFGAKYPLFTAARNFLNERLFRLIRNGFAHWAFHWEVIGGESYLVAYDSERDLPAAKLHLSEADAFHIVAFSIIEVVHESFIRRSAE